MCELSAYELMCTPVSDTTGLRMSIADMNSFGMDDKYYNPANNIVNAKENFTQILL